MSFALACSSAYGDCSRMLEGSGPANSGLVACINLVQRWTYEARWIDGVTVAI